VVAKDYLFADTPSPYIYPLFSFSANANRELVSVPVANFYLNLYVRGRDERSAHRTRDMFNGYYSELKRDKIVAIRCGNVLF